MKTQERIRMNIVAITAEYNPFHNGHRYMLQQVRHQLGPDTAIVIIMSGAFVQRGEPAIVDKWTRAAWAIQNGADCVIELPLLYAISSAEQFAAGAVRLASNLGCTHLSCGVEKGSAEEFHTLARLASSISQPYHQHNGKTSGQHLTEALCHSVPAPLAQLLTTPNALLAMEYVKAIEQAGSSMTFLPIPRHDTHNDTTITTAVASASAIRQAIVAGTPLTSFSQVLPATVARDWEQILTKGIYTDYNRYGDFILYANRRAALQDLQSYAAFAEGLENRWYRILRQAPSWPEALKAIKTRRYSYRRLCRMGAYTALSVRQTDMDAAYATGPAYARILALNQHGAAIIKSAKKRLPVITKIRPSLQTLPERAKNMLSYDLAATDLQYLCRYAPSSRLGQQDYYQSPIVK